MSSDFAIDNKAKTRLSLDLRSDNSFSYHLEHREAKNKNLLATALIDHEYRDVIGVESKGNVITVHLFSKPFRHLSSKRTKGCCCCSTVYDPDARELSTL